VTWSPELVWGSILVVGAVYEGVAVYTGRDEHTLSAVTRKVLGMRPARKWGGPATVLFTVGMALLWWHIVGEWP